MIGLGIYVAFLYAAVLLLNVTLTSPESRASSSRSESQLTRTWSSSNASKKRSVRGKSVRAAIAGGYQKGFHTIIDANVVTCITALVLFLIATAGVKGFASCSWSER